jgi:hypothetical protein
MTDPRVIRIEGVRYDWIGARYEGTAISREANGVLTRRRLSAPGDPRWSYGRAVQTLRRHALFAG